MLNILEVTPSHGPRHGGYEVEIRGSGFKDSDLFSCRVGTAAPRRATFLSYTSAKCFVPSHFFFELIIFC